jgi:hypothetical protein
LIKEFLFGSVYKLFSKVPGFIGENGFLLFYRSTIIRFFLIAPGDLPLVFELSKFVFTI